MYENECERWLAYETFKASLPPEMNWREREAALQEYCDDHGI